MSVPNQRQSSFTAEYTVDQRQILNQGVAEGSVTNVPPTQPAVTASGPVQNLQVVSKTINSISIAWTDPISGDAPVTYTPKYRVQGSTLWTELAPVDKSVHSYTFPALSDNVRYEMQVRSQNSAGGADSSTIAGTTLPVATSLPAGTPTGLQATTVTSNSATVQFTAPQSGSVPDDYYYEYKKAADSTWTTFNDGLSTQTSATITGLESNQTYQIRVIAVSALGGPGIPSTALQITTTLPATQVPNPPAVTIIPTGPGQLGLTITGATTGQPAVALELFEAVMPGETAWHSDLFGPISGMALPTTLNLVGPAGLWKFRAKVRNAAGISNYSAEVSYTMVYPTVPAKITNVRYTAFTDTQADITWDAATNTTDYIVEYKTGPSTTWTSLINVDTTATITGLTGNTPYNVRVSGRNANGTGTVSDILSFKTDSTQTAYPGTQVGKGFNWVDGADENGGVVPRLPQSQFWPIGQQLGVLPWIQGRTWASIIRLPFKWEALQPTLFGPLATDELNNLLASVTSILNMGKKVIIDCHNFGRYNGYCVGYNTVSDAAFSDLWVKLSTASPQIKNNANVFLELMNEPAVPETMVLIRWQNAAIAAIRAAGVTNPIIAAGNFWTGAANWDSKQATTPAWNEKGQRAPNYTDADWAVGTDFSNTEKLGLIKDSGRNLYFSVHQYFDASNAGDAQATTNLVTTAQMNARLDKATTWARATGNRLILSEWGGGDSAGVHTLITSTLAYLQTNNDVWCGSMWWPAAYRMQYAAEITSNLYRENLQPGYVSSQEYWLQGLEVPTSGGGGGGGGSPTLPARTAITLMAASNTQANADTPHRQTVGGFIVSDNPWGVDGVGDGNGGRVGQLPNGWSVQAGGQAISDGSISTRIKWNFPTSTQDILDGPEVTAYPEAYLGDENGTAPQSPDTYFPRAVNNIGVLKATVLYDTTSTTTGEGQLVFDNWVRNSSGTTLMEQMIVVKPYGGYGVPNFGPAAAGRTGPATGRNMTHYVGRQTIGGVQYDVIEHPAGYNGLSWKLWIFIPVTFPDVQVHDFDALNNFCISEGGFTGADIQYICALGVETVPRINGASTGDIAFNLKVERT